MSRSGYQAYGIVVGADVSLGDHLKSVETAVCDLEIVRAQGTATLEGMHSVAPALTTHGRELRLESDSDVGAGREGQAWSFIVDGVVSFYWVTGETVVRYVPEPGVDEERLVFWLLHSLLPLYLSLEQRFDFLHAGAVEIGGRAVLFIAPSMGGKSTTTGYFLRQGHALFSDDKLGTYVDDMGRFMAVPAHTRFRPHRGAEDLGLRAEAYVAKPAEIVAVYLLQRAAPEAGVEISEVTGFSKFERLLPHYLFYFPHLVARRLRYLAGLADRVPVFEVQVPHKLERLEEVYREISAHARALPSAAD